MAVIFETVVPLRDTRRRHPTPALPSAIGLQADEEEEETGEG